MQLRRTRTLGDYVALMFYYKWRAGLAFCCVLGLAVVWLLYGPKSYESEAKLFVRVGRENAGSDPTLRPGEGISLQATREQEINSIVEHLKSRVILEQAFDKVRPEAQTLSPEDRERALRATGEKVEITSPRATTIVKIWVKDSEPERAQAMAEAIVEIYLDEHMRIHRSSGSFDFYAEQSQLVKQQLQDAQAALRDAKDQARIGSVDGRRQGLETQVTEIELQIQGAHSSLAASTAKMSALREAVAELPGPVLRQVLGGSPTDGIAEMESQLFQLHVQHKQALATLLPDHPRLLALNDQVEQVEAALTSEQPEEPELVAAILAEEVANHASLVAQQQKLGDQLAAVNDQLKELNDVEVEVRDHTRNIEELEREYLAYVEKKEQSRIDAQLQSDRISNLSIMQAASFVPDRISPRPARTLLIGGVLGCIAACVVVLISDRIDPSLRTAHDLRGDDMLELASIPGLRRRQLDVPAPSDAGNGA